jgi:hypothetical protein
MLWNDDDMDWCSRINVLESEDILILIYLFGGYFTG